jgi:hypothetical protein
MTIVAPSKNAPPPSGYKRGRRPYPDFLSRYFEMLEVW